MTTQDFTLLDEIAADPSTRNAATMRAIYRAILDAALDNGGEVHASTVREHLPAYLKSEHRIGNAFSQLVRCNAITDTGEVRRSENARSRNANRRTPVYRVRDLGEITWRAA